MKNGKLTKKEMSELFLVLSIAKTSIMLKKPKRKAKEYYLKIGKEIGVFK